MDYLRSKLPKIYLLTSMEYPKYEFPHGTGVMHEYPSVNVFGKRLPNGHFAVLCLSSFFLIYKGIGLMKGTGGQHVETAHAEEISFPKPMRDWAKEKEEFVNKYLQSHQHH